jgi:hypothetical protein
MNLLHSEVKKLSLSQLISLNSFSKSDFSIGTDKSLDTFVDVDGTFEDEEVSLDDEED